MALRLLLTLQNPFHDPSRVVMATEEWVKRAIENSKTYEELPPRVRTLLPVAEWKAKYA